MGNFIHHQVIEQREKKKQKKNINKQLHNTHSKRKAQTTVMHMALDANQRQ